MPQRLKPGTVKVLSFDFAMVIRDEIAPAYGSGQMDSLSHVNGNNLYRAGQFLLHSRDKGHDETLTDSDISTVKEAGRVILRAADALFAGKEYEVEPEGKNLIAKAGQIIYDYSKRRDDKFAAMEAGGADLLANMIHDPKYGSGRA